MRSIRFASLALSLSVLAVLAGCGSSSPAPVAPTLSLTPGSAAAGAGQTVQFTATTNFSTGLEQWSVNGTVNGNSTVGTITSSGLYTAPTGASGQTVTVSVLDTASPSTAASAQVSVVGAGTVSPTANGQVASYTINLPSAGSVVVNFGPTTSYGRNTWSVNSPSGGGPTTVLVAGMTAAPANNTFHMQAVVTLGSTTVTDADHTFTTTPSIPVAQQPTITATTTPGQTPQQGVEMLSDLAFGALVYDLNGNLLWGYKPADVTASANVQPAKLLPDGNVLVQIAPLSTYAPGSLPDGTIIEVREVDLTGATVRSLDLPTLQTALNANGYTSPATGAVPQLIDMHHDATINPTTGHWLILSNYTQSITLTGGTSPTTILGDIVLDVDPTNNFQVDWVFDEFNVLDPNRAPLGNADWTHSNALVYSPTDHNLVVSMRNQNWVIKVNYNDGAGDSSLVWTLGYQGSFTLLNPDGSDDLNTQDWQYAQHEPSFQDLTNTSGSNYNLTLMDDGDDRTFTPGYTCPVAVNGSGQCLYSRAPIYTIDETATPMPTATVSNGLPSPYYTFFGGSANVLANGDEEADYCANGQVLETIPSNTSPTLVWQMTQTGTIYRAHRLGSFYPNVQWTQ